MMIGLSIAAERESHAGVSQRRSAEPPTMQTCFSPGLEWGAHVVGQLISLPFKCHLPLKSDEFLYQ